MCGLHSSWCNPAIEKRGFEFILWKNARNVEKAEETIVQHRNLCYKVDLPSRKYCGLRARRKDSGG